MDWRMLLLLLMIYIYILIYILLFLCFKGKTGRTWTETERNEWDEVPGTTNTRYAMLATSTPTFFDISSLSLSHTDLLFFLLFPTLSHCEFFSPIEVISHMLHLSRASLSYFSNTTKYTIFSPFHSRCSLLSQMTGCQSEKRGQMLAKRSKWDKIAKSSNYGIANRKFIKSK